MSKARRYSVVVNLVEVDEHGNAIAKLETHELAFAAPSIETMTVVMNTMLDEANEVSDQIEDATPLVPRDRYHQGDGEDMLRRMEDAGGNRFATGLYGDVYGFGDDDLDDPMDSDYGREYDEEDAGAALRDADHKALRGMFGRNFGQ